MLSSSDFFIFAILCSLLGIWYSSHFSISASIPSSEQGRNTLWQLEMAGAGPQTRRYRRVFHLKETPGLRKRTPTAGRQGGCHGLPRGEGTRRKHIGVKTFVSFVSLVVHVLALCALRETDPAPAPRLSPHDCRPMIKDKKDIRRSIHDRTQLRRIESSPCRS